MTQWQKESLNKESAEVSELLNCTRRLLERKNDIEESVTNIRRMSAQSYLMPVVLLEESDEEDTSTREFAYVACARKQFSTPRPGAR